jgi:hypothetical protein
MIARYIGIAVLLYYFFISANCGVMHDQKLKDINLSRLGKYSIPFLTITTENWRNIISNLKYPIIFKPAKCSGCGFGVSKIDNQNQAIEYLKGLTFDTPIIAQVLDKRKHEYTILYERYPLTKRGRVIAITERVPVKNKGEFQIHNLGYGQRRCHVVDHSHLITPDFERLIDKITKKIPCLYVGRYDVKADSLESLLSGNFGVIELNGVLGADQRCYVHTLNEIHPLSLHLQLRWFFKRILVGIQANLVHGPLEIVKNLIQGRKDLCWNLTGKISEVLFYNLSNLVLFILSYIIIKRWYRGSL